MIFLVALLSFCFSAFADECPHGCFDSDENPELAKKGHKNFRIDGEKSILEHKNPQILVDKFHGKGFRENHLHSGLPGAKEVVNFHEPIGCYYDRDTQTLISTSWGKIHYAKSGVHIVPTAPRTWE